MADDLFEQTVKATSSRHRKNATRTKKNMLYESHFANLCARTHTAHRTHIYIWRTEKNLWKIAHALSAAIAFSLPCDKTYAGIVALAVCMRAATREAMVCAKWNPIQLLKIDHIWFRWRKENSIFGRVRICEKFIFGQKQAKRTRTYRCLDTSDENN